MALDDRGVTPDRHTAEVATGMYGTTLSWIVVMVMAFGMPLARAFERMEIKYADVYGAMRTVPETGEVWINPGSELRLKVAAEIGAVVQAFLEPEKGGDGQYAQTAPLDGKDRVSLGAATTIGASLTLPISAGDGRYRLVVQWVSATGELQPVAVRTLGIDRSPPELSGAWRYQGGVVFDGATVSATGDGLTVGNGAVVAPAQEQQFVVRRVFDPQSGIARVVGWQDPQSEGSESDAFASWRTRYESRTQSVRLWRDARPAHAAPLDATGRIGFVAEDRAGNRGVFTREVRFVAGCDVNEASLEAVKGVDGWVPAAAWKGGLSEAAMLRFRVANARSAVDDPGNGIAAAPPRGDATGPWPPTPVSKDARYTTYEVALEAPIEDASEALRTATQLHCRATQRDDTHAREPLRGPSQITRVALQLEGGGTKSWESLRGGEDSTYAENPLIRLAAHEHAVGLRVDLVPAAHERVVRMAEHMCTVAAHEDHCAIAGNPLEKAGPRHSDVVVLNLRVADSQGLEQGHGIDLMVYHDRLAPEILSARYEPDTARLAIEIAEEHPSTMAVESGIAAVSVSTQQPGEDALILAGAVHQDAQDQRHASVDMSALGSGQHTLRVFATDLNGNQSPPYTIQHLKTALGLEDVHLRIAGQSDAQVHPIASLEEIVVVNGAGGAPEAVSAWFEIAHADGTPAGSVSGVATPTGIRPGFLPLGEAPTDYHIKATLRDRHGGTGAVEGAFRYAPRAVGLETGGLLRIPAIADMARAPDGSWPLTTTPLSRIGSGGGLVRGVHDLAVGLSPDAKAGLKVNGETLRPGEVILVENYDFDANEHRIVLPVGLADGAIAGPGYLGALWISAQMEDVPSIVMQTYAYTASSLMTARWSRPAYTSGSGGAQVHLNVLDADLCPGRVEVAQTPTVTVDSATKGRYLRCALQWEEVPQGFEVDAQGGGLAGEVAGGARTLHGRLQPGFLLRGEGLEDAFVPSGEAIAVEAVVVDEEPPATKVIPRILADGGERWGAISGWPWDSWWESELLTNGRLGGDQAGYKEGGNGAGPLEVAELVMEADNPRHCIWMARRSEIEDGSAQLCLSDRDAMHVLAVEEPDEYRSDARAILKGRIASVSQDATALAPPEAPGWRVVVQGAGAEASVSTNSDGSWAIDVGMLSPGHHTLRVAANKEGEAAQGACREEIETGIAVVVRDGSPVVASLQVLGADDGVGAPTLIRVVLDNAARALDVSSIEWEEQDSGEAQWTAVSPVDSADFWALDISERHGARYRARLINAHSQAESLAETAVERDMGGIAIVVAIEHSDAGRADGVAAISCEAVDGKVASWGTWKPDRGWLRELGGPVARMGAVLEEPGDWVIVGAREDMKGKRERALKTVRVPGPALPRLRIEGPERIEIGKTYTYHAAGLDRLSNAGTEAAWSLSWSLPDGSVHSGPEVDYTPGPGGGAIALTARQPWQGDTLEVSASRAPVVYRYVWPDFALASKGRDTDTGWRGVYLATTRHITDPGQEGISYQWEIAEGAEIDGSGHARDVGFSSEREQWVRVSISDTRGHATTLEDRRMPQRQALGLAVGVATDDAWQRIPTLANVVLATPGLAKGERLASAKIWLNGVLASDKVDEHHAIPVSQAGRWRIDAQVTTNQGRTQTASTTLETYDGKAASCTLRISGDWEKQLKGLAVCTLERGDIRGYRWLIEYAADGSIRDYGIRGAQIDIPASDLAKGVRALRMTAIDDRGIESNETRRDRQ